MRSTSGRGLQDSKRGLDDPADHVLISEPALPRSCGKARVGTEARIDVDLEDEGPVRAIDAEIEAGVTAEPEQCPASEGLVLERGGKPRHLALKTEAARGGEISRPVR